MVFADFVDWRPEVQITLIITLGFCFSVACFTLLLVGYWIGKEKAGRTNTFEDDEEGEK